MDEQIKTTEVKVYNVQGIVLGSFSFTNSLPTAPAHNYTDLSEDRPNAKTALQIAPAGSRITLTAVDKGQIVDPNWYNENINKVGDN